jgi:regulator of replication initiation timing
MQKEVEIVGSKMKLFEEELGVLGNDVSDLRRDHRSDADSLRLEIETLKMILAQIVPNFSERYAEMKEKARLEIVPE